MTYFNFAWIVLVVVFLSYLWFKKPKIPLTSGKSGVTADYGINPKEWNKAAIKLTVLGVIAIIIFTIPLFK